MNLNAIRISGGYNYVPRRIFLVMNPLRRIDPSLKKRIIMGINLTTFLLLISVMTVSATTYAQKITLNEKKAGLDEVLAKIRQQSGYDVIYSNDVLEKSTPVTIKISNASLEEALKVSLLNQPLTYEIEEKTVLIKMKESSFIEKVKDLALIDVHGRVVDEKGQPLPGVTVKLKDESQVTTTDKDGVFNLKRVDEKSVVIVSFIGYLTKEINVTPELGTISLELSNSKLDEVQIIAYGTTSRRLSTGDVTSVSSKDIENQPINNPILALAGRVPGLTISQATGFAGSGVKVQIQGQNSIRNGNDPFYVVDGVPYASQLLTNFGTVLGMSAGSVAQSANGNPLNFINPLDIESIEVLKDADATAIYGSRAANGAILITTKKGKSGGNKVSLNIQSGFGEVAHKLNLLNTPQYLEMRKEAYSNDGIDVPTVPTDGAYDLTFYDRNKNTNWQKVLIGKLAKYHDFQFSTSGGNDNVQFLTSANLHKETTVQPGNLNDLKASVHFSINSNSLNRKFRYSLSGSYMSDNNKLPNRDLTLDAVTLAPNTPDLQHADGTLNWALTNEGRSSLGSQQPLSYLESIYKNKTNSLVGNANLSYEILRGLTIGSTLGYNDMATKEFVSYPTTIDEPFYRPTSTGSATFGTNG